MTFGSSSSALDIINKAVEDCGVDTDNHTSTYDLSLSPTSGIKETIKNMTSSSYSYSSNIDSNRSHLRLKMSGSSSMLPGGRSSMKMPSLLQKLPYVEESTNDRFESAPSNSCGSQPSLAVSALNVMEKGEHFFSETLNKDGEEKKSQNSEAQEASFCNQTHVFPDHSSFEKSNSASQSLNTSNPDIAQTLVAKVDLDSIDLDNITTEDLHDLHPADGDILRAKHLNKLSRKEREHVLQDIHGVADNIDEGTNPIFIEDSLKKLQLEINHELVLRKAKRGLNAENFDQQDSMEKDNDAGDSESEASSPELPALEEQLGKLQQRLDQLVRRRKTFDKNVTQKQLSAKNHPMFGKMGDVGGVVPSPDWSSSNSDNGIKNGFRLNSVSSFGQGIGSSFFSPTTAMAVTSSNTTSITNEAQRDKATLQSREALAYEQALAQCRGRRRERNNSLFRPNECEDNEVVEDDDLDGGRYIDVEQSDFRLSFLRAERYDIKKAAKRFLDYFEEKRRLFGIHHLTTNLQIKDLDPETKDCVESGQIQLLSEKDRAGRTVIVGTKKLSMKSNRKVDENSVLRAFWFLSSIALEDPETEKKGVVFVHYALGRSDSIQRRGIDGHRRRVREWGNILNALPLRVASIHWCVETFALKQAANLSALMLGGSNFVRVRCHAGSDMEVQYDLITFGIPTDLFPVSMTGKTNVARHREFLRKRRKTEASALLNKALALVVDQPMIDDVNFDVSDDQDPEAAITTPALGSTGTDPFSMNPLSPMDGRNLRCQNDNSRPSLHHQQQHPSHQLEFGNRRPMSERGFGKGSSNKMPSASFNDSFCFIGHRNQIPHSFDQQQRLSTFHQQQQQQQLGMNMNMNTALNVNMGMNMNMGMSMGMGMVQQYQQKQNRSISSKSGISFSTEPVLVPGELDILLGRGRGAQNHKGNVHYRNVVETFRARYEQIPQKGAKTQLIREVVAVIYDNGGRFLKQDGFGRWIPVDPEVARDKVSHSFRNQKRLSVGGSNSGESKKRSRSDKGSK